LAIKDEAINAALATLLRGAGHRPASVFNAAAALSRLGHDVFEILMVDASSHRLADRSILGFVKRVYPGTRIVAVENASADDWLESERLLADSALAWPVSDDEVLRMLNAPGADR
jgi:DNA-binding NtrC family response regulator